MNNKKNSLIKFCLYNFYHNIPSLCPKLRINWSNASEKRKLPLLTLQSETERESLESMDHQSNYLNQHHLELKSWNQFSYWD
jgi:hypothetical protein